MDFQELTKDGCRGINSGDIYQDSWKEVNFSVGFNVVLESDLHRVNNFWRRNGTFVSYGYLISSTRGIVTKMRITQKTSFILVSQKIVVLTLSCRFIVEGIG